MPPAADAGDGLNCQENKDSSSPCRQAQWEGILGIFPSRAPLSLVEYKGPTSVEHLCDSPEGKLRYASIIRWNRRNRLCLPTFALHRQLDFHSIPNPNDSHPVRRLSAPRGGIGGAGIGRSTAPLSFPDPFPSYFLVCAGFTAGSGNCCRPSPAKEFQAGCRKYLSIVLSFM